MATFKIKSLASTETLNYFKVLYKAVLSTMVTFTKKALIILISMDTNAPFLLPILQLWEFPLLL